MNNLIKILLLSSILVVLSATFSYASTKPSIAVYVPTYSTGAGDVLNGYQQFLNSANAINSITETDLFAATIGTNGGITINNAGGLTTPVAVNTVNSGFITFNTLPAPAVNLTFQQNPAPFGVSDMVTVISPGTDGSNIVINNAQVASNPSGQATYNLNQLTNIGVYLIYGCDTTQNSCVGDPNVISYIPLYLANYSNTVTTINPVNATITPLSTYTTCTNNFLAGECVGNDVITSSQTLTGNVFVIGNFIINSGQTLTTAGYPIVATQLFNAIGTITAGLVTNNGVNCGSTCGTTTPLAGNFVFSYAGSGGGGGNAAANNGAFGGNTLANGGTNIGGNGATPSAPTLNGNTINSWFRAGINNYLASAGGGGGGSSGGGSQGGDGGEGSNGIYVQASNIVINVATCAGQNGYGGVVANGGGGGGGGGCAMLFAYNGTYTLLGSTTVTGGTGGTANGGGGVNGGNGGAGQVLTYKYGTTNTPIPLLSLNWYYPYKFYTLSPNSNFNYTFNVTYNGILSTLQTNALNVSHIPLPSINSGPRYYGLIERQKGNAQTVGFNLTLVNANTLDLSGITYNNPVIQYYENVATCPTWTVKPTSWYIKSDIAGNQHLNQSSPCEDWFSNANATYTPNVVLNYPIYTFGANVLNNPSITTLTQYPFNYIASNSLPAAPYMRQILTVNTFDQATLKAIPVNTTLYESYLFNNYSITNTLSYNGIGFNVYIGNILNGQGNVPLASTLLSTSIFNSSYLTYSNYACPQIITNNPYSFFNYPVQSALGSYYVVTVSSGFSAPANGDYLQILKGPDATHATQVEQVKIASTSIAVPLITAGIYGFNVVSQNCANIYSTNFSTWTSPIFITVPLTSNTAHITIPNVKINCVRTINSISLNAIISCNGNDTTNQVNAWTVYIYNDSSLLIPLVTQQSFSGNSFTYANSSFGNTIVYGAVVTFSASNGITGSKNFQFNLNFAPYLELQQTGIFVLIICLVCIGFGTGLAFTPGGSQHAVSNTLFILAFGFFLMYMIGLTTTWGLILNSGLILLLVFVGAMSMHYENKGVYGGY